MMTSREAAEALRIGPGRVRQMCARGQMPAEKRGRDWYVSPEAVEAARGRRGRGRPRATA